MNPVQKQFGLVRASHGKLEIADTGPYVIKFTAKTPPSKIPIGAQPERPLRSRPIVRASRPFYPFGLSASQEAQGLDEDLRKTERRKEELERQVEAMWGYVRWTEAQHEFHKATSVQHAGRLCMFERNEGVIVRVLDDEVVVRYETPHGKMEQTYDKSQFIGKTSIREGARLEAQCFAWVKPHDPQGIDHLQRSEDTKRIEEAAGRRASGPLKV